VLSAAEILERDHGVGVDLLSVTSYKALRTEALEARSVGRVPHVTAVLAETEGPLVAVSDYVTLVPDQIAAFTGRPMTVLGTDGVGMSDSREALRSHFGIDAASIARRVLDSFSEGT
jgi:pyruvate dehydrogenase E1 component